MRTTFHTLNVKAIQRETTDTVTITFDIPSNLSADFNYLAGQYLTLKTIIGGEEVRRSYSICTAPFEDELSVAVKEIKNGLFSGFANNTLKVGDKMDVMPPVGNFKITPNSSNANTYVFYAAGSGITPVISMVKTILSEEKNSTVELYYGNKDAANTIFKAELDQLNEAYSNFKLTYIFSQQESGSALTNGRIDVNKCHEFATINHPTFNVTGVYACGPEEMIMTVKDFYADKGVDAKKIHFELFTASTASAPATETTAATSGAPIESNVTVIIDDEEYSFSLNSEGKDILQAAQDEDADVPFSCKGGVCCTCRAKVLEGTVKMDLNFALEEEEVENGFILTCQAHPTSEKVVVSFDEY